jgi:hypothetical protein
MIERTLRRLQTVEETMGRNQRSFQDPLTALSPDERTHIARPGKSLLALCTRSVGEGMAEEAGAGRHGGRALCRRRRAGIPVSGGSGTISRGPARTAATVRTGVTPGEDAPD